MKRKNSCRVSLIVVVLLLVQVLACKKKDPLVHTYKMAGPHTWHGSQRSTGNVDTTRPIIFEAPIIVVDEKTIVLDDNSSDTMRFSYSDKKSKKITFANFHESYPYASGDTMIYDYKHNAIYYSQYSMSRGHETFLKVKTP